MDRERLTVSVEEAAQLLGVSRAFAYELVARKELPSVKLGRRVIIPRQALEQLLDVQTASNHVVSYPAGEPSEYHDGEDVHGLAPDGCGPMWLCASTPR